MIRPNADDWNRTKPPALLLRLSGSISIAGTRATQLGMKDAAALLDRTLQEEKETDALLSRLAQAKVSLKAA